MQQVPSAGKQATGVKRGEQTQAQLRLNLFLLNQNFAINKHRISILIGWKEMKMKPVAVIGYY